MGTIKNGNGRNLKLALQTSLKLALQTSLSAP